MKRFGGDLSSLPVRFEVAPPSAVLSHTCGKNANSRLVLQVTSGSKPCLFSLLPLFYRSKFSFFQSVDSR
jgi:hypothetical protein